MYKRILVPLDGSELAEVPLNYTMQLIMKSGAELILLHVCGPEECHCDAEKCTIEPMHRVYAEHTAEVVRGRLEEAGGEEAKVRSAILAGDPAHEILRYAEENDVSLIVMATHGRSGIRRWVMGSVAVKIHRCSTVPVRLVRSLSSDEMALEDWPEKKILVLLDGSERAEQVLPYVIDHAQMSDAEVTFIRVVAPLHMHGGLETRFPAEERKRLDEDAINIAKGYLDQVAIRFQDKGIAVKTEVLFGDNAPQEIINYVAGSRPNLIAMTTHARSALSVWPIGSTADKVIHGTSSPILLVRPR